MFLDLSIFVCDFVLSISLLLSIQIIVLSSLINFIFFTQNFIFVVFRIKVNAVAIWLKSWIRY